jgi:hypothetical protein
MVRAATLLPSYRPPPTDYPRLPEEPGGSRDAARPDARCPSLAISSARGVTASCICLAARPRTSRWRTSATRNAITATVLTIATTNHTTSQVATRAMLHESLGGLTRASPDHEPTRPDYEPPLLARNSWM